MLILIKNNNKENDLNQLTYKIIKIVDQLVESFLNSNHEFLNVVFREWRSLFLLVETWDEWYIDLKIKSFKYATKKNKKFCEYLRKQILLNFCYLQ